MKSPRCESSSSPIGVSRLTGSCETFMISRTFSGLTVCGPSATRSSTSASVGSRWSLSRSSRMISSRLMRRAISSTVGSRPSSWSRVRLTRMRRLMVSTMWTGMRIVRAWSAMARVIAWRIHHVA